MYRIRRPFSLIQVKNGINFLSHLLYLSQQQQHPDRVTLRFPKGQLANLLGTSPETLSRVLTRLIESGAIAMNGKEIALLDRTELGRLAG